MRLAALVASLGLGLGVLIGCGSSTSGAAWTKPGVTEQERGRDTLDCLRGASAMLPGREVIDQDRYRRCMMDRGYTAAPGTQ